MPAQISAVTGGTQRMMFSATGSRSSSSSSSSSGMGRALRTGWSAQRSRPAERTVRVAPASSSGSGCSSARAWAGRAAGWATGGWVNSRVSWLTRAPASCRAGCTGSKARVPPSSAAPATRVGSAAGASGALAPAWGGRSSGSAGCSGCIRVFRAFCSRMRSEPHSLQ